ncbi:MAG: methyltransferase domain-containing protein [Goleter apudmare HA4340-LM2]|jgi:SAM-dependent methyltransferase|nr:methyltransferase domain-containing protein [Goleter apudmare HA4340-LM2]
MTVELQANPQLKFTESTQKLLCCPVCKSQLKISSSQLECTNYQCQAAFPIINKTPVLINDNQSVFAISDYQGQDSTILKAKPKIERALINLIPSITLNLKAKKNYKKFAELVKAQNPNPRVLIIGGSIVGEGMEPLLSAPEIELVETDVSFGEKISVVCDAHDIPFADNSFDGVVVQAVLEHVADPYRCVEEIHRVLKADGLVYAETPFIAQVHLGKYDFTRFTHLGHRRLFRKFEEIDNGAVCGPGTALAWSYQYFLLSFFKSSVARALVKVFARITSFWLTYFDYLIIDNPGSFDAALGYYFIGKKSEKTIADRELINLYRGTQSSSF